MGLPSLLGRNTTNHASAELQRLFYMESTLIARISEAIGCMQRRRTYSLSGETLAQHLGVLVDEQVLDGILVALRPRGLRERPATGY